MEKIRIYIIGNGGRMPDTAMSIAAVNQSPGVPIVPEQWGGLEPDTAMSIAAPNGAIYLCREY